jgi:hypothetical protein
MNTTVILDQEQGLQLKNCMKYYPHIFKLIESGAFDLKLGRYTVDVDKDGLIKNIKIENNFRY